jgi:CheY-like chemotaxis protein
MATRAAAAQRILVVDDEPLVCDSIKRMLVFDGHHVEVAFSAQEALELFEKATFDVALIDYLLPQMKGDELATLMKARKPDLPIILISATAETLQYSDHPPAHVDMIVSKPFALDDLRRILASVRAGGNGTANPASPSV